MHQALGTDTNNKSTETVTVFSGNIENEGLICKPAFYNVI